MIIKIQCQKCLGFQKTERKQPTGSKKCVYCGHNIQINKDTIKR